MFETLQWREDAFEDQSRGPFLPPWKPLELNCIRVAVQLLCGSQQAQHRSCAKCSYAEFSYEGTLKNLLDVD